MGADSETIAYVERGCALARDNQMNFIRMTLGFGLALAGTSAYATDLTLAGTADDAFNAYLSTSDSTAGTLFASGNSWGTTYTGSITLTPGTTYYLHIDAFDVAGAPSMFIGELGLTDSAFWFDNGGQSSVTGDTNWSASTVGFGGTTTTITDLGPNGTSPWGSRSGISSNAHYIWTPGDVSEHRYFTVKVNSVPEPMTLAVVSFGAMALLRRRPRKQS